MKALIYHGPGEKVWDTKADPVIVDPSDAIVRIDSSTICGTDLHILKGDVPEVTPGTVLGHEAVGTIVETGAAVTTFAEGDRVLVSCITSCGRCRFCKEAHYGLCTGGGGWIFGHLIDGLQAEYARVPFVDTSVYKVPEGLSDEQVLFLADILPTAYEVGVLNGKVDAGDTVVIVGAGPIGLATIMTAKLYTPARIVVIDLADSRLEKARAFGADVTINNGREDAVAMSRSSLTASVPTSWSKPSVSLRRSSSAQRSSGPVGTSRTLAFTATPQRCISRPCGSRTSRSRPVSWTRSRPRGCCS